MRTYRQLTLRTGDLDQVMLSITVHMRGRSDEIELGYEITSGPGGEPLQMEALGLHWSTSHPEAALAEIREMLLAARDFLVPF